MDFSFIIPVYNMEKYVVDCIQSVVHQCGTVYEYEIIVVDDGSTDHSLEKIQELAAAYRRVKVIHQENGGLSVARNTGFANATGTYVWFVDSDDWISHNSLCNIEEYLKRQPVDALLFSVNCVAEKSRYIRPDRKGLGKSVMNGRDVLKSPYWPCQVPYTIYRRSYLAEHQLQMMPGIYHEDKEFSPRAYYHLETVGFIEDVLYYRRENPTSITHTVRPKRNFDNLIVAESLSQFTVEQVEDDDKVYFYNIIAGVMNNSLSNTWLMPDEDRRKFKQQLKKKSFLFKLMRKSSIPYYRIEGMVFSLFPSLAPGLYRLLRRREVSTGIRLKSKSTPPHQIRVEGYCLQVNGYCYGNSGCALNEWRVAA